MIIDVMGIRNQSDLDLVAYYQPENRQERKPT